MASTILPVWRELSQPDGLSDIRSHHFLIPLGEANWRPVLVRDARAVAWDNVVDVSVVSKDDVLHTLNTYLSRFDLTTDHAKSLLAALEPAVRQALANGGQFLSVTGKAVGEGTIKASNKTIASVTVADKKTFSVSMVFVTYMWKPSGASADTPAQRLAPTSATGDTDSWFSQLRWIHAAQDNVWLTKKNTRQLDIKNDAFPWDRITDDTIHDQPVFFENMDTTADVTVYVIRYFSGDHSAVGMTFPDMKDKNGRPGNTSKGEICIAVDSKCATLGTVIPKWDDPFMVTLAHELTHFVLERRPIDAKFRGLHLDPKDPANDGVLFSNGHESTAVSGQLLDLIYGNPVRVNLAAPK
jgi:hypothetical protein